MEIRKELKYSNDHEWVRIEGDRAYIGITDLAQDNLGDVVFLELSEVGEELSAGDAFGTIESVKAASDVYAPIAGTIVEVNEDIMDEPERVNDEPYDSWLVAIEIDNEDGLEDLMDWEAYEEFCQEEA
ncbi:MAG: glycine cleavage system protein GcvH [Clostridiales bacterium]|nr:glycine cleavage system protein GcvH [Clostridiales bacterium]